MSCFYKKYTLHFRKPGGTSRGVLLHKDTYFIFWEGDGKLAIGECNRFAGLSFDDRIDYEEKLQEVCKRLPHEGNSILNSLHQWPSIRMGVETLLLDKQFGSQRILFPKVIGKDGFHIPTNGLIWMGTHEEMMAQVQEKLKQGFTSLKLKIGAIDFQQELDLLQQIRKQFSAKEVEIRLDANGAFSFDEAKEKLERLSAFDISYIEQPIRAGQWQEMAELCHFSPIKIALDEELIGIVNEEKQNELLATINPPLLILKPALIGGFEAADVWKKKILAQQGSWVITSALESNIGLNAIAQYTAQEYSTYAQGLGTGQLFTNNFPSPYTVDAQGLHYHLGKTWDLKALL